MPRGARDPWGPAPAERRATGVTSPTRTRKLFDELEAKVGSMHAEGRGAGLHGDVVREVPGSAEPPD